MQPPALENMNKILHMHVTYINIEIYKYTQTGSVRG